MALVRVKKVKKGPSLLQMAGYFMGVFQQHIFLSDENSALRRWNDVLDHWCYYRQVLHMPYGSDVGWVHVIDRLTRRIKVLGRKCACLIDIWFQIIFHLRM